MAKKRTAKERVLEVKPQAVCVSAGLSLKFVIIDQYFYPTEISGRFVRERDAWADAAKRLKERPR